MTQTKKVLNINNKAISIYSLLNKTFPGKYEKELNSISIPYSEFQQNIIQRKAPE